MKTLDHITRTLDRAVETEDLTDLYVCIRRIPRNGNTLLHAYESEILIPLEGLVSRIADELTVRDLIELEETKA